MAQVIDFIQLSKNWNAHPVSPEVNLQIVGKNLIMEIYLNHYMFDSFVEGDKARITFENSYKYSLNSCNDEGYYYGQYRINWKQLEWGEFYEIISGLDRKLPKPIVQLSDDSDNKRHFLFFFKDETFECLADNYKVEFIYVQR
ncbi:hypothetical protein [Sphingobacterium siyangense]